MLIKFLFVLLILIPSPVFADVKLDIVEEKITAKDWEGALTAVNDIPAKSTREKDKKRYTEQVVIQISKFLKAYDGCQPTLQSLDDMPGAASCFESLRALWKGVWKPLPFSSKFNNEIKDKLRFIDSRVKPYNEKLPEYREQQARLRREAQIKQQEEQEAERLRRQKLEEQARERAKWEQEGREKYYQLEDKVANDREYKIISLLCELCEAHRQKKDYESKLKEEQKYSARYGVVNLSKMEQYKQGIMRADAAIKTDSPLFQKATNRKFTTNECKTISEPYKDYLDKSTQKIMRRYFIESLKEYDEEKRTYILKHIEERFPDVSEISE